MNNIKTAEDVREWAKMIVDAKGDKYTPLGKADLLAIARYIVEAGWAECPKDKPSEEKSPSEAAPQPSQTETTAIGTAEKNPSMDEIRPTAERNASTSVGDRKQTTTATMMRSYALRRAGFTVQQAYDKFLEWCKDNKTEATVMDFSTGKKSISAAFAYWLAEIISVEVPNSMTTTRMGY